MDFSSARAYAAFDAVQRQEIEKEKWQDEILAAGAQASVENAELLRQQVKLLEDQLIEVKERNRLLNDLYETAKEILPEAEALIGYSAGEITAMTAGGVFALEDGIAVANACRDALEAADYITVSNEEHAIARVIRDLDSGKIVFDNIVKVNRLD